MAGHHGAKFPLPPPKSFSFRDELAFSEGQSVSSDVADILMGAIPGAISVERADQASDRNGVDYWVLAESSRRFGVDIKARRDDFALRGRDDLAIETWSVVEQRKPGWSWDSRKRCDFILWVWKETGRWCLVSFPQLCATVRERAFGKSGWRRKCRTAVQKTDGGSAPYHSECVYVPRDVVWRALYDRYAGKPAA